MLSREPLPCREDNELYVRLLALVQQAADVPVTASELTDDTGLLGHGIGLDSIEILALVSAIEAEFGVTIADEDLKREHFATIGALARFVGGLLP